jgi:hypothetical protein
MHALIGPRLRPSPLLPLAVPHFPPLGFASAHNIGMAQSESRARHNAGPIVSCREADAKV